MRDYTACKQTAITQQANTKQHKIIERHNMHKIKTIMELKLQTKIYAEHEVVILTLKLEYRTRC